MEDFLKFEVFIDYLMESNDLRFEHHLDQKILDLKRKPIDSEVAQRYLELYAEICGEEESLRRFDRLFDIFKQQLLVTEKQRLEFIQNSPVNRWF